MASISFNDYFLKNLSYVVNPKFDFSTKKIDLSTAVNLEVHVNKKTKKIITTLDITLGSLENTNSGFCIKVSIVGDFHYDVKEIESYGIGFEKFIKESTMSILWSFVRPFISDLISRGNKFPRYILPVINVSKLIDDHDFKVIYDE